MCSLTLFFGMLDPKTGDLRFTNAGHNPPYRLDGKAVEAVTLSKGRPLGVRTTSHYDTGSVTLAAGETLYLYTDGATEAHNRTGELFAEQRLEAVLRESAGDSTNIVVTAVGAAVQRFADGAAQSDGLQ